MRDDDDVGFNALMPPQQQAFIGGGGDGKAYFQNSCIGRPDRDPIVATWKLSWWSNLFQLAAVGLLIGLVITTGAMGYGLVSTAPQLERTTGYTHDMKISTEGAINGATEFYQKRMAEFPPNQVDVWMKQFSNSMENIDHILASIKAQITHALDDMERMIKVAVTAAVQALVPDASKAKVVSIVDNTDAIIAKYRAAADLLTPEEIAEALRSGAKFLKDSDDIISAIGKVIKK